MEEAIEALEGVGGALSRIAQRVPGHHLQMRGTSMADKLTTGTILIEKGTLLPDSLRFESEPYSNVWRRVKNLDGFGLERKIREAGWNFFYMAGEITASAFGFDREKTFRRTVNRVLARLKSEGFNSLEITQVARGRFLGLCHMTVSAHARHVQESAFLFQAERLTEWERSRLAAKA
jgi:hypothetical protein